MSARSWTRGSNLPPDENPKVEIAVVVLVYFLLAFIAGVGAILWRIV